jgi:hypothetical protein
MSPLQHVGALVAVEDHDDEGFPSANTEESAISVQKHQSCGPESSKHP